jgi:hypothetical protein
MHHQHRFHLSGSPHESLLTPISSLPVWSCCMHIKSFLIKHDAFVWMFRLSPLSPFHSHPRAPPSSQQNHQHQASHKFGPRKAGNTSINFISTRHEINNESKIENDILGQERQASQITKVCLTNRPASKADKQSKHV